MQEDTDGLPEVLGAGSGIQVKETFDSRGKLVSAVFLPSADQLRFAMHRASLKNDSKSDNVLLRELGIPMGALRRWENEYGDLFKSWLALTLENFRAPVKHALFAFGVDQAFRGDFRFWKEVSRTVGAITPEQVEVISREGKSINELRQLSDEELAREEARLLASLTGAASGTENPTDSVSEGPGEGGQESGLLGDGEVQTGS